MPSAAEQTPPGFLSWDSEAGRWLPDPTIECVIREIVREEVLSVLRERDAAVAARADEVLHLQENIREIPWTISSEDRRLLREVCDFQDRVNQGLSRRIQEVLRDARQKPSTRPLARLVRWVSARLFGPKP